MAKDEFANGNSSRLWVTAAACAVALHATCIALALARSAADNDNALGAPAIEVGLELLATRTEPTDLPPGPDSEATVASAPAVEQKVVEEETELPKEQPTETEDPDRAVSPRETRPNEHDPKPQPVEAFATMQSAAAEARATPGMEATISTRSTAPAQGTGQSNELARVTWQKRLIAHLDKHKRYPSDRSMKGAEMVVGIVLDRMGRVLSTSIITGSGDASFDDAALAMMRRADPVPAPPPLVADAGLSFTLPVMFRAPKTRTSQR
jgi:TonB family protein